MWKVGGKLLTSRLLVGTAQYPSLDIMHAAIIAAETNVITVSLRRQLSHAKASNTFWDYIKTLPCEILPNTAGCHNAMDAVTTAEMAREIFATNWIKLEVIGDDYNLQPDPFELIKATRILIEKGFIVFPYCTDDLVVCQRLIDCGCEILMPWAAPIGSGKGILNSHALTALRSRFPKTILIVDAGIGKPSHAVQAMELGFDGVLLNTAISLAQHPIQMAKAFNAAVKAGRDGYEAGLMLERDMANPSTPNIGIPFWHQEKQYE